jgi:hypothetical protein
MERHRLRIGVIAVDLGVAGAVRRRNEPLHLATLNTEDGVVCQKTTKVDSRVGDWAAANNVEIAYTPTNSSWLNRIEAQFTALRYFTLDGTDHRNHRAQASMIRR